MMMVYTQSGETYDLPDGDFALHGNKIFDLLNHELASFDNADDAEKAADELEKAIMRGDKTFTFAAAESNAEKADFATYKNRDRFIKNVFAKVGGDFSIKLAYADENRNVYEGKDGFWTFRLIPKRIDDGDLYIYEFNGKFKISFIEDLLDHILAEYDKEEEARKAIIALGEAVKRGDKIFTFPKVEEVTTPATEKDSLQAKIFAAELAAENARKERENFFKNLYLKMCGDYYTATGFVQYVTDYAKVVYRKDGNKYIEDAAAFAELKAMENKMKELYHKAHELNNIALKAEILKAKIAEQKNSRKSVID